MDDVKYLVPISLGLAAVLNIFIPCPAENEVVDSSVAEVHLEEAVPMFPIVGDDILPDVDTSCHRWVSHNHIRLWINPTTDIDSMFITIHFGGVPVEEYDSSVVEAYLDSLFVPVEEPQLKLINYYPSSRVEP